MTWSDRLRPIQAERCETLHHQCRAAQARYQLFAQTPECRLPVVVAVSGGLDSVVLLHLLHDLTAEWGVTLHIAHLDHNLRPDSALDAALVGQLAHTLELPFHTERLPPGSLTRPGSDGLEAAARRARYRFLTEVALTVTPPDQTPVIALAHHANDQAETLLLHLVRGSGLQGLGGMRWVSERRIGTFWPDAPPVQATRSVRLVRPFLGVQRADLLRYAQARELPWREDGSNTDQRLTRNWLRHTILPSLTTLNPNLIETLGRTAQLVREDQDRLLALDQATLSTLLIEPQSTGSPGSVPDRVVLDLMGLRAHPPATQRGVLRAAVALLTPETTLDFAQSEALVAALPATGQASGPHPINTAVGWSVAGATTTRPARLSLHRPTALPFAPIHPWLDATWRATIGTLALPTMGTLRVNADWCLAVKRLPVTALPADWRMRQSPWQTVFDAERGEPLSLTTPQPGQRFAPLGMNGRQKLVGDFFTDRKIPVALRAGWPLILDGTTGTVLWVCGVQPGHHARLTDQTQTVLQLFWHPAPQA